MLIEQAQASRMINKKVPNHEPLLPAEPRVSHLLTDEPMVV